VISDLDDTVLRSDVASKLRLARTIALGNAHTRLPFAGVAAFYRGLHGGADGKAGNPIFYVSSSPWNLYDVLCDFLELRHIPSGPLLLRDWGLSPAEPGPTGHATHKTRHIEAILGLYPHLPFILVGDSGQEDPEIYHRVVHAFPRRIQAVYIRNVSRHPERVGAIQALAREVEAAGSTLLLADDTLAAARHAAAQGWLDATSLRGVEEAVAREEA
jgi:phosphatidate phosphatase APP1